MWIEDNFNNKAKVVKVICWNDKVLKMCWSLLNKHIIWTKRNVITNIYVTYNVYPKNMQQCIYIISCQFLLSNEIQRTS